MLTRKLAPVLDYAPTATFAFTGELGRRLDAVTQQWILPAPLANPALLEMFRNRERVPYQNQVPWAGEFAGKYLTHAVQIQRLTGDAKLRTHIAWFVGELCALQADDGYLGPWPKPWRLRRNAPGCAGPWDAWGHYHAMLGLLLWHRESGDQQALRTACRIGDLLCNRFLGDTGETLHGTGEQEMNQAPIHSLALLYQLTGTKRYLQLARQIEAEFALPPAGDYLRQALAGKEFYETPKPRWESLHPILGLAELYLTTGKADYRRAFEHLWWSMVRGDRHNNGGFSSGEKATGNPYDENPIETCCTVAWMAMSVDMLRLTGNPVVADELEFSLLNSGYGMMSPGGRWVTYNTPMTGARRASAHDIVFQARPGSPELNCCSVNGPRALGLLSEWAVMTRADGLALNYYGPGMVTAKLANGATVRLVQRTDYPRTSRMDLTVRPSRATRFTLALRIPHWSARTTVTVNGTAIAGVTPATYLELARVWRPGDRVRVDFDFTPHFWVNDRQGSNGMDQVLDWQWFGPVPRPAGLALDQVPTATINPPLAGLTAIPASLSINGHPCARRRVTSTDGILAARIFAPEVGGNPISVAFAELEHPRAEEATLAFAADWWCTWFVNGERVYDTHATGGNGGEFATRNHAFKVKLRAGRNLLAVHLSGGSSRGCWLSLGRLPTAAENAAAPPKTVHATSIYRGPLLLALDPRHQPADLNPLPALDSARLELTPATDPTWLAPWLLFSVPTVDGRTLQLCDFASAGWGGNAYQTWLPVRFAAPPPTVFSPTNPLRSFRVAPADMAAPAPAAKKRQAKKRN